MSLLNHLRLMSRYNQWMNQKVYQTAQKLDHEKIKQDQGAFFGSILGTLNHIFVADVIWLRRFSQHSQQYQNLNHLPELANYTALDQIVANDLEAWYQPRNQLDQIIINWCQEISLVDLDQGLQYTDTQGQQYQKNFGQLIEHFFNHQTHHRGQVSSLINQQGVDLGVTDLLMIIPEQQDTPVN